MKSRVVADGPKKVSYRRDSQLSSGKIQPTWTRDPQMASKSSCCFLMLGATTDYAEFRSMFPKKLMEFFGPLPEVFRCCNTCRDTSPGVRFACPGRRILSSISGRRKNIEYEFRKTIQLARSPMQYYDNDEIENQKHQRDRDNSEQNSRDARGQGQ